MTDMSDQRSTVHITFLSFRKVPDSVITLNTLGKYDLDYRIIEEAEHLVVDFSGLCQLNWGDKKCLQWLFLDSVIFITAINNLDRYFLSEKKKKKSPVTHLGLQGQVLSKLPFIISSLSSTAHLNCRYIILFPITAILNFIVCPFLNHKWRTQGNTVTYQFIWRATMPYCCLQIMSEIMQLISRKLCSEDLHGLYLQFNFQYSFPGVIDS